jgi:5'-nucleotidase
MLDLKIEINGTFNLMTAVKKSTTKEKKAQPIILITNDDGITAPGIRCLVEAVKDLGRIVVVAPDKPQSGMGHAITIG